MKDKITSGKKLLLGYALILILPLICVSCAQEPKLPSADEAKAAVWEKIEMANDRWKSGDPMGFVDCAAKDITWVDDLGAPEPISGSEALKTYLEGFKGQIPEHENKLVDSMFQVYGDIVIVNYRYQTFMDGALVAIWRVTSVYRYEDGDWFSVLENWSEVTLPAEP